MSKRGDHRVDCNRLSSPPGIEFLYETEVGLTHALEAGPFASGQRLIVPITPGSRIEGPRISGWHRPGSTIVQLVRPDGISEVSGNILIETDDGYPIFVRINGIFSTTAEAAHELAAGRTYDPADLYSRALAIFDAPNDSPHAWLNRYAFLATAERQANAARTTLWQIL